eukprot:350708-Chlamydomonas_euryale.AAC.12
MDDWERLLASADVACPTTGSDIRAFARLDELRVPLPALTIAPPCPGVVPTPRAVRPAGQAEAPGAAACGGNAPCTRVALKWS